MEKEFSDTPFHSKTVEETLQGLSSDVNGLSHDEVRNRFLKFGFNEIPEKGARHPVLIYLRQFHSFLIYILIIAALISFFYEHFIDAYVIFGVIFANVTIGFIHERKAQKSVKALKKMIVPHAKVYREGKLSQIDAIELVPGDIILLEEGDKIPADARLIEIKNFRTVEASLTGESFPVDKDIEVLPERTGLADRKNMVWMGTFVAGGQAKAIVTSTGISTAIGKIAQDIKKIKKGKTHFEKATDKLALKMCIIAIIGANITFLIGYFIRDLNLYDIFLFTISSLVSGIPEGLLAVLTIVLAIGANHMAKRNAIVRRLPVTASFANITVIATDKTGTLTQNTMNVQKLILPNQSEITVTGEGWTPSGDFYQDNKIIQPLENTSLSRLLEIGAICSDAKLLKKENRYEIIGDPTEAAITVLAQKAELKKEIIMKKVKEIDELPFNPKLKYETSLLVLSGEHDKKEIYVTGGAETVLNLSSSLFKDNTTKRMMRRDRQEISVRIEMLAKKGMRVLAIAYKDVSRDVNKLSEDSVKGLVFVGVVGMKDPPKPGVKEAIIKAKKAGIRVIMKTGDHKDTAVAIAKEIGLISGEKQNKKYPIAFTEQELSQLSQEEFEDAVKHVPVFARLTPSMKFRIVETLQKQGNVVAMTGDGVNDAPALKKADIGIAMGIVGTDVARESSEIILADDNFASIVDALVEGKIVFNNIRQTTAHLITTSISEDVTIISSLLFGLPLPLLPLHVLWLNLVTDGTGDIALATEPGHGDELDEPPKISKSILSKELIPFIAMFVVLMSIGDILLFYYFLPQGLEKARTVAFLAMMFSQLFNLWNMRSMKQSVFKIGFFSNKFVNLDFILSIALVLPILYIPYLQGIFKFVALGWQEWILAIVVSSTVLLFGELYKYFKYSRK